ncbi:uncharacterized protein isoform X2 [Bombus fervidus]|uniref:uncharacterized protein isoform X2 n=1 Tax=Bombus fervidus TaxID=203811 RepID=UPI003AB586F1
MRSDAISRLGISIQLITGASNGSLILIKNTREPFVWRNKRSGEAADIKRDHRFVRSNVNKCLPTADCIQDSSQRAKITMMTPIFVISVFLFALTCPCNAQADRSDDIRCQSNTECQPGHCCTIGPMRYSVPQCKAMQKEGEVCRPGNVSTLNVTLGYPDGSQLTLKDVYYIFCPCADGLSCDIKEGVCNKLSEKHDPNRLSDENKKQDG